MRGLLDGYPRGPAYDEMFGADGLPHPHMRALYDALQTLTEEDLARRGAARDRSFRDQGVTFSHAGEEWVFPLDLIPRLIPAAEWEVVEAGVAQRVRALEAFLADVYGAGEVIRDGVVPRSLITTSAGFCRPAHGIRPPNGVRIHLAGIDLVRDQAGVLRVLEDNLRVPSGMSYVVENRRTMARVFPGLFLEQQVRPVASYPGRLLDALRRSAPAGVEQPTVVLLTPGVHNAAYFEHAFLARKMGIELVEGRDLFCREQVLYMRSIGGQQRVDVVYRRVNDDFFDPVHFRPESVVGCPGILNAARAGNVTIANAIGNGVADDKLTYTYVPELIEYYLGERPLLPNVTTFRLDDPDVRADCLARLDQLVIKPVEGSGGSGIVIGPHASDAELAAVRERVLGEPRAWIAQELVLLSTSPAQLGDQLLPRHIDLRPFAVNDGEEVRVLPGGLTRVALREGSLIVNSSQGGGSKDTWVLTSRPEQGPEADGPPAFPAQAVRGSVPDQGPHNDQPQQQQ
ncbi:circularly permuted type 2 ATP-grasp protein [Nonomuraea aurantiaca]|uniref:circularly permuted type 2 ATP-grasp protein n=1 Tax=Nonomuraea aurantiaca TaxID=2878562 RepID=UPI001CDA4A3F|nr:circularly permuted type 2 ATP-grasp protein [Nonomuraea aurantiaca]MCA2230178.1 circularly permuted type 2 ATP-grasp protein [Nonomuraea aurantiaca]